MMKYFFLVTLILTITCTANVQANDHLKNWIDYTSSTGAFSVSLPMKPRESSVNRMAYTAYSLDTMDDKANYKIVFSINREIMPDHEKAQFLENAKTMYVNSQQGKIKKEQHIQIEGNQGWEVAFITNDKRHINYRIFFNNNILYSLSVTSLKRFAPKKSVEKFFDSFEFKELPPPQNPEELGHGSIPGDHQKTNE